MATKLKYDEMLKKYRDIANTQSSFDITEGFDTPTMGEMIEEDLAYDAMMKVLENIDGDSDPAKAAFYIDPPYSESLGYHDDVGAFVVNAKVRKHIYNGIDVSWRWHYNDGDTLHFYLKDVDGGNKSFVINNREYNSVKEYFWHSYKDAHKGTSNASIVNSDVIPRGLSDGASSDPATNADDLVFSVRFVGIDTAETPHLEPYPVNKLSEEIVVKTVGEIKNDTKRYHYLRNPVIINYDTGEVKLQPRKDSDPVRLIKIAGEDVYHETLMVDDSLNVIPTSNKLGKRDEYIMKNPEGAKSDTITYLIVGKDETKPELAVDAIKAQLALKKLLDECNYNVTLVLDSNTMNFNQIGQVSGTNIYYGSPFYTREVIEKMIRNYKLSITDLRIQNLSYSLYGSDVYGRILSCVYIKTKGKWINANKFVLASSDHTLVQKDYNDADISSTNSGISDAFKLWTYDMEKVLWLDSLEELSKDSYKLKMELHKNLSGLNGCDNQMREHTVMIGDTLFMVPPTSIRSVTHTQYEKQPLIRAKGSMTKGGHHNERIIELELFFAGDSGINGIPMSHTFPSGEKTTYYMNGLRALISQFKFTPFLPIENAYVNDVLGIEAVSMLNMSIQTVPEYPGLLQVVLTLQEFNYRLYMPDLPIGIEQAVDVPSLAETTPVFAMSFQWEAFRYYYQRSLIAGEDLFKLSKDFGYNTGEYNQYLYNMRTCLQPTTACGSSVEFFIPDQNWLDNAYKLYKDKRNAGTSFEPLPLTDNIINVAKELGTIYDTAQEIADDNSAFHQNISTILSNEELLEATTWGVTKKHYSGYDDRYLGNGKSYLRYKLRRNNWTKEYNVIEKIIKPIQDEVDRVLSFKSIYSGAVVSSEEISYESSTSPATYKLHFNLKLDLSSLNDVEKSTIKEYVSIDNGTQKDEVLNFDNGDTIDTLRFTIILNFGSTIDNSLRIISCDWASNAPQVLRTLKRIGDGEITVADFNNDMVDYLDYKDASKMPFVPYMDKILVTNVSVGFSNTYSETKLRAVDGNAAQYIGGSDATIELKMVTCDEVVVSALNTLPGVTFDYVTHYKQILPCTPLRIKNEIAQMCGINEVLIDMLNIDTVPEYPGMYEITMRLSSVDRTLRQRESMRKLEVTKNGGFVGKGENGGSSIRTYFETNNLLARAELYPDLELPSLDDLRARGYAYIKYTLSSQYRVYPDPDFYMVYGNGYTAAKIKKIIKDGFDLLSEENSVLDMTQLDDKENKLSLLTKCDDAVGLAVASQCKNSDEMDKEVEKILLQINNEKSALNNKHDSSATMKDTERHLKFLLTTDITDGWKLKPGYQAPLCDEGINEAITNLPRAGSDGSTGEHNQAASIVKSMRKKAIELIDAILEEPIKSSSVDSSGMPKMPRYIISNNATSDEGMKTAINNAYDIIFVNNKNGAQLIELLNPFDIDKSSSNDFSKPNMKKYITGYAYAAACTYSGLEVYKGGKLDKGDYQPRFIYTLDNSDIKDEDGNYIPLCKINANGKNRNVSSLKEALEGDAYMFGPFSIKTYTVEELVALTRPQLPIKYVGDNHVLYKGKIKDGFLDPYYNKLNRDNKELKTYKQGILVDPSFSAQAYYRNLLVWMRKMILDGLLFSSVDVVAKEVQEKFPNGVSESEMDEAVQKVNGEWGIGDEFIDIFKNPFMSVPKILNTLAFGAFDGLLGEDKDNNTELYVMLATLSNTLPKSFVARMIYPFIMDICKGDQSIHKEMMCRNYSGLESITNSALNPATGINMSEAQSMLNRFFKALEAIKCLEVGDTQKAWADEAQKMANSLAKQVYVEASNNPKKYVMHSFYDMLMNDKRGRLVRAFPTFYMIVIDEGRKIGYWKLHDNFYNMSAISQINIVKSRKIPTDTCTITMSNMYKSYAANYGAATTQQYADIYGVKDAIDNIFSPTQYYEKSEIIRSQVATPDTIVIKPGARIHVRLGYGSDASRLPVSFNGKIAEVNVGTVVDIVAQGDGHELCNPLNAFGAIEANHLEPSQWQVRPFRNFFGSFTRGGYSPRDLLAEILSAEYGGAQEMLRDASKGRYFNQNPFGIIHFGDKEFKSIFEQGEVVQNLFEVSDVDYGKGYNELIAQPSTKKSTPVINTSLYDKTFWDLLHISARAGKDHIGAIRDFGFRSTVFLGRPNDYYAYEYIEKNGSVYEKRKPFQQYHYIDSQHDIIYNAIKATEANMKTNAVGIWQASGWFVGRNEETVGPVYLDQNIYPEYQKSMTYDTGLLADGNGGFDIKPITKLGEKFCGGNENDDKVNKELARRMTISALRDSVKDMYEGELCIIGSPAIKPYDRIELLDIVESMNGAFECESVIQSLNVETGFTTTIIPDVIVRDINNPHEIAVNQLVKTLLLPHIITLVSTNAMMHVFFRKQAKIAKALARASVVQNAAGSVNRHAKKLFSAANIQSLEELSPSIGKLASNLGTAVIESSGYMKLNAFKSLVEDLAKNSINNSSSLKDLIKYMKNFNSLDMDDYERIVSELLEELTSSGDLTATNSKAINEITKSITELKELQADLLNGKMDFKEPLLDLVNNDKVSSSTKKAIEQFLSTNKDGVIKNSDDLKAIVKILDRDDVYKVLTDSDNKKLLDKVMDSAKALKEFSDVKTGGISKFIKTVDLKDFNTVLDSIKAAKGVGALLNLAAIVPFAVELLFTEFIIADIKESFMSWFKNIQTLTVYPMKQHDRHFYAGMSGCKGSVYGAPPADGWNSIQGMVIKAYEYMTKDNPLLAPVSNFIIDFVLGGADEFEKVAHTYKVNLGILDEEQASEFDIVNSIYSNVSKSLMLQGRAIDSLKTRARIQSFDGTMDNVKSTYSKYRIKSTNATNDLIAVEFDPTISSHIESNKFGIWHNMSKTASDAKLSSQGSSYNLKLVTFTNKNGKGADIPMLRTDALEVLKLIIDETNKSGNTKKAKIFLKSGTRVNGSDWRSTGYQYIIGSTKDISSSLDNVKNSLNDGRYSVMRWNKVGTTGVTSVEGADINYRITVYPPL